MPTREPSKPGLPAERTLLSWERSAFGFLVGGALVLLHPHGPFGSGRVALATGAALLALLVLGLGYRRSQRINSSPTIAGRVVMYPPRLEVLIIGGATVSFSVAIVAALLLATTVG